jgi:hypothetical protein
MLSHADHSQRDRPRDYTRSDFPAGFVSRLAASFDAAVVNVDTQAVNSILRATNKNAQRIIVRKSRLLHSLAEPAKVTRHRADLLAERVALFGR